MEYIYAFLIAVIVFFGIVGSFERGRSRSISAPNPDLLVALQTANETNEKLLATMATLLATMATIERQRDEAIAGWKAAQR